MRTVLSQVRCLYFHQPASPEQGAFTVSVHQWVLPDQMCVLTNLLQLCFQTILCSPTLGERSILHRYCCVSWQGRSATSLGSWFPIKQHAPGPNYGSGLPSPGSWSAGSLPSAAAIYASAGWEGVHQHWGHAPRYSTQQRLSLPLTSCTPAAGVNCTSISLLEPFWLTSRSLSVYI